MGTWVARISWRAEPGHVKNRRIRIFLGRMILRAASLATALVTGGVEQNPGLGMEGEKFVQILCGG